MDARPPRMRSEVLYLHYNKCVGFSLPKRLGAAVASLIPATNCTACSGRSAPMAMAQFMAIGYGLGVAQIVVFLISRREAARYRSWPYFGFQLLAIAAQPAWWMGVD